MSEQPTLVIGVGNPFRRDDGAGPFVARQLAALGAVAVELPGEGAELIEVMSERDRVVVVDAARSGAEPGTIHRFEAGEKPLPTGFFSYSTHQFGVAEAVETARALGRLPKALTVYGIEGADFAFGEILTPEVEAACAAVVSEISARLPG